MYLECVSHIQGSRFKVSLKLVVCKCKQPELALLKDVRFSEDVDKT